MPPLIASELKEMRLTPLELNCKLQQSLQLQEIKSSLQLLERSVKILSEKSDKRSTDADVIDVDSLLSSFGSNPPPSESSCTSASLPFGSPPSFGSPVLGPDSPSSNFHPMIPSLSGKQMTFSRTAVGVLAVGRGIAALRVEYWSWKGEYLQPGMTLWPVVMGTTQL